MSNPAIDVRPSTVACPAHGEHLRANWPSGFAVFSMTIVQALFETSDAFLRELGWRPGHLGDLGKVNTVLARRPACYFVGRELLRQALMDSGIGRLGLCLLCGRSGMGGPYTVNNMGHHQELDHVCFECALDAGDRLHAAHPNGGVWRA